MNFTICHDSGERHSSKFMGKFQYDMLHVRLQVRRRPSINLKCHMATNFFRLVCP